MISMGQIPANRPTRVTSLMRPFPVKPWAKLVQIVLFILSPALGLIDVQQGGYGARMIHPEVKGTRKFAHGYHLSRTKIVQILVNLTKPIAFDGGWDNQLCVRAPSILHN